LSKNEQRRRAEELAALEAAIAEAEATLAGLAEALQAATESQVYEEVQRLSDDYGSAEKQLEALLERWEALAHEYA
jgi:hypothetical protein